LGSGQEFQWAARERWRFGGAKGTGDGEWKMRTLVSVPQKLVESGMQLVGQCLLADVLFALAIAVLGTTALTGAEIG
jgi:hypothetical protein